MRSCQAPPPFLKIWLEAQPIPAERGYPLWGIFKNMNSYTWTLIIWWKRKIFIYFIKCYWIKKYIFCVRKQKNIQLCFTGTKLTAFMSTNWSAVLYLICLFFSFSIQNWIIWYTCKYFFQHVLKFSFYNLHF